MNGNLLPKFCIYEKLKYFDFKNLQENKFENINGSKIFYRTKRIRFLPQMRG